ncbi:hypothetical protein ONS95_000600 [Cadophora gregata]|uniref:uncharacterized protein n=1 Tax=Cadophora gregata TaxID=51156 RepID=UPI0026DD86BD|nr:uncharacterized protein ONS95_000600 [Cadophora gregata]KAK0125380.1 hypothetical protein ONS96_009227 [Cadophora gregata f. sp. sojae]KAK0128640.1 hypothetical protein ONS95_000600 [Cadophora gregata]
MSVSVTSAEAAAPSTRLQPYQCQTCGSRFTRYENLKRHATVHSRSGSEASLPCGYCQTTFSRRDLRSRHIKKKHPEQLERRAGNCRDEDSFRDNSRLQESGPSSALPQDIPFGLQGQSQHSFVNVDSAMGDWVEPVLLPHAQPSLVHYNQDYLGLSHDINASTSTQAQSHEPVHGLAQTLSRSNPKDVDQNGFEQNLSFEPSSINSAYLFDSQSHTNSPPASYIPDGLSPKDVGYLMDDWFPSPSQSARGYQLYFSNVSQFVPFLHRPTFDATETPRHLGLSMLCLAYQYGEDPDCGEEAGSGERLSQRCFHRARVVAAEEEERVVGLTQTIVLVQAYWLLQVYVMMYLCGSDSAYGHKMHSRMISLTRFGGLTQPMPGESTTTEDLDDLWREFIKTESHKRTVLAVHQIDALWYQLFSIPRSLSHLEIKHDLPCPEDCWTAFSSALWAHRQLAARQSTPLVPYSDAIKLFLSPTPDIESLPKFDLYGAINIAQFLLSSAREVSGWSTMTGRLSMERFEPLQTSLFALERLIRPPTETVQSTHAISCEATWEMAMLELLLWSPLHTSGVVGGSVDTFLTQSTYLASSCQLLHETVTKTAAHPHVDWFLRYLETTPTFEFEPPWLILYAYKAFLIAWQLVREGFPGAMLIVGVNDSDVRGAVLWAKRVFHRKSRQRLSKLIDTCLDSLEE